MNEQQNVNNTTKPKKKRSFWWLKLLLILILFAAGIIAGMMLSSQAIADQIMERFFPQYEATEPVVVTVAPSAEEKPIEFKPSVTVTPKPTPKASKAPVEIISPDEKEKEQTKDKQDEAVPEASVAPEASPEASMLPAFQPAETSAPETQLPSASADKEPIGIDAALEAALKHIGAASEEVVVYCVSREKDDGLVYYDVCFGYNGQEYKYAINAYSGVVEGWKTVRRNGAENGAGNAAMSSVAPDESASVYVSAEDAKATALFHAGYKEHETRELKVSLEIEHNKVVYEIEFWAENYDYDYLVDAESGLVIFVEKDRD